MERLGERAPHLEPAPFTLAGWSEKSFETVMDRSQVHQDCGDHLSRGRSFGDVCRRRFPFFTYSDRWRSIDRSPYDGHV